MTVDWFLIGAIVLNLAFSTISDVLSKYWGITNNQTWLFLGLLANMPTVFFYMSAIRLGGLAITTSVILLLTLIIAVCLGAFFFHEHVSTSQWVGVGIGLIATVLISGLATSS